MATEPLSMFDLGKAQWPALPLDRAVFEQHVHAVTARAGEPRAQHAGDLFLACACASDVSGAIEAFERSFGNAVVHAVARVDRSPEFVEEARQTMRVKLFARTPPKIIDYGGRAKLRTWLTTATLRTALNLHESKRARAHDPLDEELFPAARNLEEEYVRGRYKDAFVDAIAAATNRLSSRERTLLRLHLGQRLGIDRLAVIYGVGRSTVARWLVDAKSTLLESARAEIQARLGASPSEIVDVGVELRSVLDVSLVRLLASARP
jgi:RNA polymerase sigma-70 factor (ECF subfamily)